MPGNRLVSLVAELARVQASRRGAILDELTAAERNQIEPLLDQELARAAECPDGSRAADPGFSPWLRARLREGGGSTLTTVAAREALSACADEIALLVPQPQEPPKPRYWGARAVMRLIGIGA